MKNINKKKVRIITCHNVYNYGASLQEYALLTYIKNLGYDVLGINYTPSYLSNHYKLWKVSNPKWEKNIILKSIYLGLKLPGRLLSLKRKKSFDDFSAKYIKTTSLNYKTNNDLKDNIPEGNVFICGSDQIWNSFFENGKDPAFYLDFVPKDKLKISYAASFATETIDEEIKPFVKEKVKAIDVVSVRESSGKNILNKLDINNVTHVLDPVFLLEKNDWSRLEEAVKFTKPYILVYDMDKNLSIKTFAQQVAAKNNWLIISASQGLEYANENYYLNGPGTFLFLVKNAALVISNSFHAVAFSLIYNKQFYVFNRNEKINTRMNDLLSLIECKHLLLNSINFRKNNFKPISDYNKINQLLEIQITKSKLFLSEALNYTKKNNSK